MGCSPRFKVSYIGTNDVRGHITLGASNHTEAIRKAKKLILKGKNFTAEEI